MCVSALVLGSCLCTSVGLQELEATKNQYWEKIMKLEADAQVSQRMAAPSLLEDLQRQVGGWVLLFLPLRISHLCVARVHCRLPLPVSVCVGAGAPFRLFFSPLTCYPPSPVPILPPPILPPPILPPPPPPDPRPEDGGCGGTDHH